LSFNVILNETSLEKIWSSKPWGR